MKKYRKTTAKTPQGVLRAVAAALRQHGWTQGETVASDGSLCLYGGLGAVLFGDPDTEDYSDHRLGEAVDLLKRRIGGDLPEGLAHWNDRRDRKVEEVLAVLGA